MGNWVPVALRYESISFGDPRPMIVIEVGTGRVK